MDGLTGEEVASYIALSKSFKDDDDDPQSASSSDAGVLSEASSDDNGEEDYRITALPRSHRKWATDENRELDPIAALAAELRDMPLLPCAPEDPTGEEDFDELAKLDAGVGRAIRPLRFQTLYV